jgi:hypothetical protein
MALKTDIAFVFAASSTTHGVTDIHLLTNPPTLEPAYHLLHTAHPDHYAIFLACPTDTPGEIVYGEVQIPGGLAVGKGDKVSPQESELRKAIVLHQPEEVIPVDDNICRFGFRFDWYFHWEGKKFKWSRNCVAGIMKSMTLSYIPPKQFKDDPPVTLALFSPSPSITLLDYNFPRVQIEDIKGFEIIIILFASLFIDIIKSSQIESHGLTNLEVKKETQRLQKLERQAEEKYRKIQEQEIERETERLRKLAQQEFIEQKKMEDKIAAETERLRREEGWYPGPPELPPRPETPRPRASSSLSHRKKKRWWNQAWDQWNEAGYQENNNSKYSIKSA